ncbi:hypothetical protein GE09DRAFT_1132960 [Coniochaeta sp. 2T2.1]|nr:hypothetical protein GE09DRAFT_1132960 [Coniochaeta sp. 2T2.1]
MPSLCQRMNSFQYHADHGHYPRFAYPPDNPLLFVKVDGPEMRAEGDMQLLAFEWLIREGERTKSNIFIPEVYKIFTHRNRVFLVMQFVPATPIRLLLESEDPYWKRNELACLDLIAEVIKLLSRMPVPGDATLGRYSTVRTLIKHPIFKDHQAPLIYRDVQEMKDHFNRVAAVRYKTVRNPPEVTTASSKDEPLIYCYSDLNDENFLLCKDGEGRPRLCMVDFEHASFLPTSFLAFAIAENRWHTTQPLQRRLALPQHNVAVMKEIYYVFQISVWAMGLTQEQREAVQRGVHGQGGDGTPIRDLPR